MDKRIAQKVQEHFEKNKEHFHTNSVLVHGDLINPSNILVKNDQVTGIIDWECALAGDPAWDFCFNNKYELKTYFKCRGFTKDEENDFRERMKLYEPLYLAWVLYVLEDDPESRAYSQRLNSIL